MNENGIEPHAYQKLQDRLSLIHDDIRASKKGISDRIVDFLPSVIAAAISAIALVVVSVN